MIRWDPLHELVAMSNRFNRRPPPTQDSVEAWAPPVEIFERHDHLVIRAEIAGVQKEAMYVRIENGVLTLEGERKQEADVKQENAHLMERIYGTFRRSLSLPTTVDATKVTASYKDGVLEVTVPKAETAKPRQVEIKAA